MSSKIKIPSQNDINVYLLEKWEKRYRKKDRQVLNDFMDFIRYRQITWQEAFTHKTLKEYQKTTRLPDVKTMIRGFSLYLYNQGKIKEPLCRSKEQSALPQIYEEYLTYLSKIQLASDGRIKQTKRVLCALHLSLKKQNIKPPSLSITHIDAFLADFLAPFAVETCRAYRDHLRGFLRYLYHERKIIRRDLAPLVVTPRCFSPAKPPKFFRSQEIEILFSSLKLSSPWHLRVYAMIHLAYTMGLRPTEISLLNKKQQPPHPADTGDNPQSHGRLSDRGPAPKS
jgi:integrase